MRQFFQSRRLRYQIWALQEDQWQIVEIVEDGRESLGCDFEKHHYEALSEHIELRARVALGRPGTKTIKVIRERILDAKHTIETEILKIDAPPIAPTQRLLGNSDGEYPICRTAEDFLFRPALRAIGITLRPFLDRFDITAIELMTAKATNRRLTNADRAINEAVLAASRQQATVLNISSKQRAKELEGLVEQSFKRLRDAEQFHNPPRLTNGGIFDFFDSVEQRIAVEDRRFWILRGLSQYVTDSRAGVSKLELVMPLIPIATAKNELDPIDETIAGIVDQPETIKELLGSQPDLKSALFALASLITGTVPVVSGVADVTSPLAGIMGQNILPKAASAFWERLARSLDGNQSLSTGKPAGEWAALDQLKNELLPLLPPELLPGAEKAIARRIKQVRQELLGK